MIGVRVQQVFTILIADRNSRVRGFLERELGSAGYRVRMVDSACALLQWAFDRDPIDLIILDPDLPDADESQLMTALRQCRPQIPVIVHAHHGQCPAEPEAAKALIVVEKGGSSVERLKEVAGDLLKRSRPAGFPPLNEALVEH